LQQPVLSEKFVSFQKVKFKPFPLCFPVFQEIP